MLEWFNSIDWANVEQIVTIVLGAFSAILTIICFALKFTGNKQAETAASKMVRFNAIVQESVSEAEGFKNLTGPEKKAYAMAKVKALCVKNKVECTDPEIDGAIEAMITLSKVVNGKK